jgi:hypothetical protein
VVDHRYIRVRGGERGQEGKKEDCATQHVGGRASGRGKENLVILLTFMFGEMGDIHKSEAVANKYRKHSLTPRSQKCSGEPYFHWEPDRNGGARVFQ